MPARADALQPRLRCVQPPPVGQSPRCLDRQAETIRQFPPPAAERRGPGPAVKAAVEFSGSEGCGVAGQPVTSREPSSVQLRRPVVITPSRGPDPDHHGGLLSDRPRVPHGAWRTVIPPPPPGQQYSRRRRFATLLAGPGPAVRRYVRVQQGAQAPHAATPEPFRRLPAKWSPPQRDHFITILNFDVPGRTGISHRMPPGVALPAATSASSLTPNLE